MLFGDTEIKATATDIALSQSVKVYVDFMNESNPKYVTKLWKKFFYILLFITITIPISILYLAKFWNTISLKNVSEIFDAFFICCKEESNGALPQKRTNSK